MDSLRVWTDGIKEIEDFARENRNEVSFFVVQDIIKNKANGVMDEDFLNRVLYQLRDDGIRILPLDEDEDYDEGEEEREEPWQFAPSDVNITQVPITISNMMERLENDEFDLSPTFQRNRNLWDARKQSQLIESLMLKIPIPAFYFDASKEGRWVVIDGLQRLTVFQNYLVGVQQEDGSKKKSCFSGLQYLTDFNGKTFDQLPRQYIRRIKESSVVAYNVMKGTPEMIVFNIFQRINTGGVQLNDQEIRQALYSGKGTDFIKELAEREEFKEATQFAVKPDRMLDREYTLRFLSFTEMDYQKEYKGDINSFLIKGLKKANDFEDPDRDRVRERFVKVMNACRDVFGRLAFRKYNQSFRRGPISKAIFEIWAICFGELSEEELGIIRNKKDEFIHAFGNLLATPEFVSALKSGDSYAFIRRVAMTREIVKEFL